MPPEIQPLLILGTGDFAVEVADLVSEIPGFHVAGFVQSVDPAKRQQNIEGLPVYWIREINELISTHRAVCAIGTTQRSRFIEQAAALGIRYATLVHPTARVSPNSTLGEGTIVSAGVVIGAYVRLGRHVIVNRGALIGHHTEIGDFVTIGPGANIAGSCRVGEAVTLGIGAVVSDHLEIGPRSFVGAGATVTKNVPAGRVVVAAQSSVLK
jgi:acetyltransferase EpsM